MELAPEPADEAERRLSFCSPSRELRTHHLHVVKESFSAAVWLAFRDYLRANPTVAQEYGVLKAQLSLEHGSTPNERVEDRAGEEDWVSAVATRGLRSAR